MTRKREDRAPAPAASCRASCRSCHLLQRAFLCRWDRPVTGTAPAQLRRALGAALRSCLLVPSWR
eukprot:4201737-Pleurochrysis_carterae.AAC.1